MINNIDIDKLKKIFVPKGEKFNQIVQSIINWANISGKPTVFPPETHNHDDIYLNKSNTDAYIPTSNYHPATKKYVDDNIDTHTHTESDITDLQDYALKSNVLELDNTTAFTPDADYEPATKKYVDDNAGGIDINSQTEKTTPVDDDIILIEDSEDSYSKKKVKFSNLPSGAGGGTFHSVSTIADLMALTPSCSDIAYCSATKLYYVYAGDFWYHLDNPNAKVNNLYGESFHIDASEIKTAIDGASLFTEIKDLSGYGHLIKPLNSYLPYNTSAIYKTGIVNGLPVLRFGGNTAYDLGIMNKVFGNAPGDNLTIFAVGKYSGGSTGGILSTRPSASAGWTLRYASSTTLAYFHTGGTPTITSSAFTDKFNILVLRRTGSSIEIGTQDGLTSPASITGFTANTTETLTQIGCEAHGASSLLNGDIAEIFVFESAVTGSDYTTIINALKTKYGIS